MKVLRVYGPPGTGKTTYIAKAAKEAVELCARRDGIPPAEQTGVMIVTHTRSAAAELRSRGIVLGENQIATLHAHCFRALGGPKIVPTKGGTKEEKEILESWNSQAPYGMMIDTQGRTELLSDYSKLRATLATPDQWAKSSLMLKFSELWSSWKRASGLSDYNDLIDDCFTGQVPPLGHPSVIFVDEAQDLSKAQVRLLKQWGEFIDRLVIVGDPDQALQTFSGGDADAFFSIPADETIVLDQSYRVPAKPHALAVALIERTSGREKIVYRPRPVEGGGSVEYRTHARGRPFVIESLGAFVRDDLGKHDGEIMFLATTWFGLSALEAVLKSEGLLYWNPFGGGADGRHYCSPLHPLLRGESLSTLDRVKRLLRIDLQVYGGKAAPWTWGELGSWIDLYNISDILVRGTGRKLIDDNAKNRPTDPLEDEELDLVFLPEALDELLAMNICNGFPLKSKIRPAIKQETIAYIEAIAKRSGGPALLAAPRIILSTIHGAKGSQANTVCVSTDLSPAELKESERDEAGFHEVRKKMYVALTRTKNRLVIFENDSGRNTFKWDGTKYAHLKAGTDGT